MIPRRLIWLFDALALVAAFGAVYGLFPILQPPLVRGFDRLSQWVPVLAPLASPPGTGQLSPLAELIWILIVVIPPVLLVLQATSATAEFTRQSNLRLAAFSLLAMMVGLSLASLALFALRIYDWSRLFVFLFGVVGAGMLVGYRALLRLYFAWRRRAGYYTRNLLLIGRASAIDRLLQQVGRRAPPDEYHVIGYLEAPAAQAATREVRPSQSSAMSTTLPRLGSVADLESLIMLRSIQEVLVVGPEQYGEWVGRVLTICDEAGMPLNYLPEALVTEQLHNLRPLQPLDPLRLPAIVLTPFESRPEQVFLKRVIDVVIAGLLLVVLSPLMGGVALAIKLTSRGPVFYRWKVIGQHGREFVGYKFRTMVENADALKPALLGYNEMSGPVFKMTNDPRITAVGRVLRKYSLDELPQLYSVLRGNMSLVGPRPAFRTELERYEFSHKRKLSMRPGMTCLWQVRGRKASRDFGEWVRMDLEYIDNWSLWLDFKIMLWTVWAVIGGTGR